LWVIHRFAEQLEDHAVLKGGMALRLLDSPRFTNDVDYVFVPYESKKDVVPVVKHILEAIEGASIHTTVHSTMIRSEIRLDAAAIQLEVSVSPSCASVPVATAALAALEGAPSQIVRIMAPAVALAHKLAAWNERRLVRDLYDAYFLAARARATPDRRVLLERLAKVESRIPRLRRRKRMTLEQLAQELGEAVAALTDTSVALELGTLVDARELAGLALRIQVALRRVAEEMVR